MAMWSGLDTGITIGFGATPGSNGIATPSVTIRVHLDRATITTHSPQGMADIPTHRPHPSPRAIIAFLLGKLVPSLQQNRSLQSRNNKDLHTRKQKMYILRKNIDLSAIRRT